jgi:exonuclease III
MSNDIHVNPGPVTKSLNICHINIRSLNPRKLLAIETSISDFCDIITLSETFLNESTDYLGLQLEGFKNIEHLNRKTGTGGGVAIFIKKNLICHRMLTYEIDDLEAMWHELQVNKNKILLCVCYRPPGSTVAFWDKLNESLDMAKASGINDILLIGDLNSDPQTFHGQKFINFCNNNNMHMNVHEPTRITATSSTILDQIVTSRPNLVTDVKIEPPISTNDHCTVTASLNLKPKTDPPFQRLMWNYKKADIVGLKNYLSQADWTSCFLSNDVNLVAQHWSEILLNGAREFIPNHMVLIRPKDTQNLKCKVLRMFHRAKSTGREEIWDNYKQMNNDYHEQVQQAKKLL